MELDIPHIKLDISDATLLKILEWCKKNKPYLCKHVFGEHVFAYTVGVKK